MNTSLNSLRFFFVFLSVLFMTTFMVTFPGGSLVQNTFTGIGLGLVFGTLLIGFDLFFKRFNLRTFNIAILGIFIGYLMGQALVLLFDAIMNLSHIKMALETHTLDLIKVSLFLLGTYLGTLTTLRFSDEIAISIPFIRLSSSSQKRKDLILDSSAILDARIIDLATTGMLDQQLILPRFIIKELTLQAENSDEAIKGRAKYSLDIIKKLESLSNLEIRISDHDFPEAKDSFQKLLRLAKQLNASLFTADLGILQTPSVDGIKIINLHALSNALKPLMQTGKTIRIKIQRFGKEPNQGIGYLEDGTMVVVNGGGDYIGETLDAQVLSVKHTTSGRMIFCNAPEYQEPLRRTSYDQQE